MQTFLLALPFWLFLNLWWRKGFGRISTYHQSQCKSMNRMANIATLWKPSHTSWEQISKYKKKHLYHSVVWCVCGEDMSNNFSSLPNLHFKNVTKGKMREKNDFVFILLHIETRKHTNVSWSREDVCCNNFSHPGMRKMNSLQMFFKQATIMKEIMGFSSSRPQHHHHRLLTPSCNV